MYVVQIKSHTKVKLIVFVALTHDSRDVSITESKLHSEDHKLSLDFILILNSCRFAWCIFPVTWRLGGTTSNKKSERISYSCSTWGGSLIVIDGICSWWYMGNVVWYVVKHALNSWSCRLIMNIPEHKASSVKRLFLSSLWKNFSYTVFWSGSNLVQSRAVHILLTIYIKAW